MLRQLRSGTKKPAAKVVLFLLVAAFALWGVSDIFRGTISDTVAEVGDTEISSIAFSREVRGQMQAMGQQLGMDMSIEQARQFGIDQSVLENLISGAALDEKARELGLTASDAAVRTTIEGQPGFQGVPGAQIVAMLNQAGFTEDEYVAMVRNDLARQQLLDSVALGITPPSGLVSMFHDFVNETRVVEYFVLTPEDTGELAVPTEEDLMAFHEAHPELFNAPEYRSLQYVVIGPDQVSDEIALTDEELRAEYDNPQVPFNTPETRGIEQVTFPDQAEADAAYARMINEGADFTAIATERGLSADDIARGDVTAAQLGGAVAEAAFALPEPGIAAPVQGPFGWIVSRVTSITPGTARSFEEAEADIRQMLILNRAITLMNERTNAFEDARAGGALLADAAAGLNLPAYSVAAVDRAGLQPDGTPADVPADPAFLEQAFATNEGAESFVFAGEDGTYYSVRVDAVTPVALRPFDTVRAEVEAAWAEDARGRALQTRAMDLAAEAQRTSLEAVAASLNRPVTTTMPLPRNVLDGSIGTGLLEQIFSAPEGTVLSGLTADNVNYAVLRVGTIAHPVPDAFSEEYQRFRQGMAGQMAQDVIQSLVAAAREEAGVTTYPDAIELALTQGIYY